MTEKKKYIRLTERLPTVKKLEPVEQIDVKDKQPEIVYIGTIYTDEKLPKETTKIQRIIRNKSENYS